MSGDTEQEIFRMACEVELAKSVIESLCKALKAAEVGVVDMHILEDKYEWDNVLWETVNDGMARIGVALADMLAEYDCMCGQLEQAKKGGSK